MILFSGSNVGKIKTAVFSKATKTRRPRRSWMAKPSPAGATEGAKIPAAPAAPGFSKRRPESTLPEALDAERAEHRPATPASFPPAVIDAERAPAVIIERAPSPVEIARLRALEEKERQLERAIEDLAGLRRSVMSDTEQQVVELAAAIARRVVGRELTLHPDILLGLAFEGLDSLAEGDRVKVR